MLQLYPLQLYTHLKKGLRKVYLLFGNEPILLQESYKAIRKAAEKQGFIRHYTFQLDNETDWKKILNIFQTKDLFSLCQTIQLFLPKSGLDSAMNERMLVLAELLKNDSILILRGEKLNKSKASSSWFILLSSFSVYVICQVLEKENLFNWIIAYAESKNLKLEDGVCQLLCSYYKGNLSAIVQMIERFILLCKDGKVTLSHIKNVIEKDLIYTVYDWINALFMVNKERALHILDNLHLQNEEPTVLIYTLQREILTLINIKWQSIHTPLPILFKKYRILKDRREIIIKAFNSFSKSQLYQAVKLLIRIELMLKKNHDCFIWNELENLSLILCHTIPEEILIHD